MLPNPRNKGLCYAFDIPSEEVMNALVSKRFPHGLIFYPAGTRTLRFRLMTDTTDEELLRAFAGVYRCFVDVAADGKLPKIPSFEAWVETLSAQEKRWVGEKAEHTFKTWLPKELPNTTEAWDELYGTLFAEFPQLLHSPWNRECSLKEPWSLQKLQELYKTRLNFTQLDLLWQGARHLGTPIRVLNTADIEKRSAEIEALESSTYEKARITPASEFLEESKDPRALILGLMDSSDKLIGIALSAPLHRYKKPNSSTPIRWLTKNPRRFIRSISL